MPVTAGIDRSHMMGTEFKEQSPVYVQCYIDVINCRPSTVTGRPDRFTA